MQPLTQMSAYGSQKSLPYSSALLAFRGVFVAMRPPLNVTPKTPNTDETNDWRTPKLQEPYSAEKLGVVTLGNT